MEIEIVDEPPRLVAVIRRTVPAAELVDFYDSAYGTVAAALRSADSAPAGPALAWMHHGGEDFDIAAGFPVERLEPGPLAPGVEVVEIPGGRAVTAEYQGPYDGLRDAWQQLEDRRTSEGFPARGDTVEVYLTEPAPDGDATLNRTRLVMLLG